MSNCQNFFQYPVTETNPRVPMTQEAIYLIMEIDPVSEMWFVNPTIMNDVQNKLS
jgi:hypothetical protein